MQNTFRSSFCAAEIPTEEYDAFWTTRDRECGRQLYKMATISYVVTFNYIRF